MPVDHPSETYAQRASLRTAEFAALRRTVSGRGTARMVIMPLTCAVWATLDERAHRPDEHVRVSHILADAKVFARMALSNDAPRAKKK